jgi:hypothetical protein
MAANEKEVLESARNFFTSHKRTNKQLEAGRNYASKKMHLENSRHFAN